MKQKVRQRQSLLDDGLLVPVETMAGREYYASFTELVDFEQLESEEDEEYNLRIYTKTGMVRAISADFDFIKTFSNK